MLERRYLLVSYLLVSYLIVSYLLGSFYGLRDTPCLEQNAPWKDKPERRLHSTSGLILQPVLLTLPT